MGEPSDAKLTVEVDDSGDVILIVLNGRLDAARVPVVDDRFSEIGDREGVRVVLDLAGLTWIDSPGVGQIVKLVKRTRKSGGEVALARMTGQPQQIFKLLKLDSAIPCFETIDDAASKLVNG